MPAKGFEDAADLLIPQSHSHSSGFERTFNIDWEVASRSRTLGWRESALGARCKLVEPTSSRLGTQLIVSNAFRFHTTLSYNWQLCDELPVRPDLGPRR